MTISPLLTLSKRPSENHGEVFEITAKADVEGAPFETVFDENGDDVSTTIRMTSSTAIKLAWNILREAGEV